MGRVFGNRSPLDYARFSSILITEDDGSEKELYALTGEHGYIFTKEEIIFVIEKALEFYDREDSKDWIDLQNRKSRYYAHFEENENGKFIFPQPEIERREFKKDHNWSCKCEWCGNKVSSKEHEAYYLVQGRLFKFQERACSIECGSLIWKDRVKNWLYEREDDDLFEMEDLICQK
jgi:hypothetical protein